MKKALDDANLKINDYDNVVKRENMQKKEIDNLRKNIVNSELRNANLERLIEKKEDILADLQAKVNVTTATTIQDAQEWLNDRQDTQNALNAKLNTSHGANTSIGSSTTNNSTMINTPKLSTSNPFVFSPFPKTPGIVTNTNTPRDMKNDSSNFTTATANTTTTKSNNITNQTTTSSNLSKSFTQNNRYNTPVIIDNISNSNNGNDKTTPLSEKVIRRVSDLMDNNNATQSRTNTNMISTQISQLRRRDETIFNQQIQSLTLELSIEQDKCKELMSQLGVVKEMNEQYVEQLNAFNNISNDYNDLKSTFLMLEKKHDKMTIANHTLSNELKVKVETIETHVNTIHELKVQHTNAMKTNQLEIEKMKAESNDMLETVKAKHSQYVSNVKKEHSKEIDLIQTSNQDMIQNLRDELKTIRESSNSTNNNTEELLLKINKKNIEIEHLNNVNIQMNSKHQSEIERLSLKLKEEMEQVNNNYRLTSQTMQEKLNQTHNQQVQDLNSTIGKKESIIMNQQQEILNGQNLLQTVRDENLKQTNVLKADYDDKINQYNSMLRQLEKTIKEITLQMNNERELFMNEKKQMVQKFESDIALSRKEHDVDVNFIRDSHKNDLAAMREKHTVEMKEVNEKHQVTIIQLKEEFHNNLNKTTKYKLEKQNEEFNRKKKELETMHANALNDLRTRYDDEIISSRNSLIAKHDSYINALKIKHADEMRVETSKHSQSQSKLNQQVEHFKQELSRLMEKHELEIGLEIKERKESKFLQTNEINMLKEHYEQEMKSMSKNHNEAMKMLHDEFQEQQKSDGDQHSNTFKSLVLKNKELSIHHANTMKELKKRHHDQVTMLKSNHHEQVQLLETKYNEEINILKSKFKVDENTLRIELEQDIENHVATIKQLKLNIDTLKNNHLVETKEMEGKHKLDIEIANKRCKEQIEVSNETCTKIRDTMETEIQQLKVVINHLKTDITNMTEKHIVEMTSINEFNANNIKTLKEQYDDDISLLKSKSKDKAMKIYKDSVQKLKSKHDEYTKSQTERYNKLLNEMKDSSAKHDEEMQSLQKLLIRLKNNHVEETKQVEHKHDVAVVSLTEKHNKSMETLKADLKNKYDDEAKQVEHKHNAAIVSLTEKYNESMEILKANLKNKYDETIKTLQTEHTNQHKLLCKRHKENMYEMKSKYDTTIQENTANFNEKLRDYEDDHEDKFDSIVEEKEKIEEELNGLQDKYDNLMDQHEKAIKMTKDKYKGLLKELDQQSQTDLVKVKEDVELKWKKEMESMKDIHEVELRKMNDAIQRSQKEIHLLNEEIQSTNKKHIETMNELKTILESKNASIDQWKLQNTENVKNFNNTLQETKLKIVSLNEEIEHLRVTSTKTISDLNNIVKLKNDEIIVLKESNTQNYSDHVEKMKKIEELLQTREETIRQIQQKNNNLIGTLEMTKKQLLTYQTLSQKTTNSFNLCKDNWNSEKEMLSQSLVEETNMVAKLYDTIKTMKVQHEQVTNEKNELRQHLDVKEMDIEAAKNANISIENELKERNDIISSLQTQLAEKNQVIVEKNEYVEMKLDELQDKDIVIVTLENTYKESKENWEKEKAVLKDLLVEEQRVNSEIRLMYDDDGNITDLQFDTATDGEEQLNDITLVEESYIDGDEEEEEDDDDFESFYNYDE